MSVYIEGQAVRVTVTCKVGAVNTDPTTLVFRVRNAVGAISTHIYGTDVEVVRDSLGVFHMDVLLDAGGSWDVRCETTGAAAGASETSFDVNFSRF